MKAVRKQLTLLCFSALIVVTCALTMHVSAQTFNEGFETGTKTSYATADVQLSTGFWTLNDALIGNLTTDRKTGAASARIRNIGSLTMGFDLFGAGTVSLQHAVFGTDGSSTWELSKSTDDGQSNQRRCRHQSTDKLPA